jgi:hypothetical protein
MITLAGAPTGDAGRPCPTRIAQCSARFKFLTTPGRLALLSHTSASKAVRVFGVGIY